MRKIYYLTIIVAFGCLHSKAQDVLYFNDGTKQSVKIIEMGTDEIQYKTSNRTEAPVFKVDKSSIKRIGFNEKAMPDKKQIEAPSPELLRSMKKTKALKVEFLTPLADNFSVGYERLIRESVTWETKVAKIGIGMNNDDENPSGFYIKSGIKLIPTIPNDPTPQHPLAGFYIKPEFIYSRFTVDRSTNYSTAKEVPEVVEVAYNNFAFNFVVGAQGLLAGLMTIDFYAGLGYGGQSSKFDKTGVSEVDAELKEFERCFSHRYSPDLNMVITGGISVGIPF